jgi:hypothetical protein
LILNGFVELGFGERAVLARFADVGAQTAPGEIGPAAPGTFVERLDGGFHLRPPFD